MDTFPLFITGYREAGETTIGNVAGGNIIGTPNRYSTVKFKETGSTGKRRSIGRSIIPGAFRICATSRMGDNTRKQIGSISTKIGKGTKIMTIAEITAITETTGSDSREAKAERVTWLKILL